jgi:hypothetical protein
LSRKVIGLWREYRQQGAGLQVGDEDQELV